MDFEIVIDRPECIVIEASLGAIREVKAFLERAGFAITAEATSRPLDRGRVYATRPARRVPDASPPSPAYFPRDGCYQAVMIRPVPDATPPAPASLEIGSD